MSNSSIYEMGWINLVFENRNKKYGAYQLRQENTKTTLLALFIGVLVLVSGLSIPIIYDYLNPGNTIEMEIPDIQIVTVSPNVIMANKTKKTQKSTKQIVEKAISEVKIKSNQLVNPIVVALAQDLPVIAKNSDNQILNSEFTDPNGIMEVNSTQPSDGTTGITSPNLDSNAVIATVALDRLPEFPGGINKFYNYVGNNFEKTEIEGESAIRIFVSFIIEKDGTMSIIQVKKDPGYGLGKEAVRVLKSLKTKWSPGILNGNPARTAYNLPITIKMN